MGETYVELPKLWAYAQHLDLVQNFPFLKAELDVEELRPIVELVEAKLPAGREPVWFGSNHDHSRLATRWAGGDERKARAALFVLLTLRGTAILYQGDELALEDGVVSRRRITDVADPPRDPERTPMPWTPSGTEWQRPVAAARRLDAQRRGPARRSGSTLNYVRELVEQRKALRRRAVPDAAEPDGVWAYARGDATCVVNLTEDVAGYEGRVLEPWQGVILQRPAEFKRLGR